MSVSARRLRIEPAGADLEVPAGFSLLEAAEAAGWRLPSSCRNGTCRECRCLMASGSVRYRVEWPGLSLDEKHEGWVLPCVAEPMSDVVLRQPGAWRDTP